MRTTEDMENRVDEIDENPGPALISADAVRLLTDSRTVFDGSIDDRAHLPLGRTRANDDEIRYRTDATDIQADDIFGFVVVRNARKLDRKLVCTQSCHDSSISPSRPKRYLSL